MRADPLLLDPFDGLWPEVEVDIIEYSLETGNPEPQTLYGKLKARRSQRIVREVEGVLADYTYQVVDVFYISRQGGELPGISEEHKLVLDGLERKIITATDQGGQGQTLEIVTERPKGRLV